MNFKIFWLNVSKCCTLELILEKMHRLKVMLQVEELDVTFSQYNGNTKNQIVHLRSHLRKLLGKKQFRECLIVLVDVQDENICKAFYELPCKFLITTRHIERLEFIPQESKITIEIKDGFTHDESHELFRKAFRNQNLPSDMTEYVNTFHSICYGHPFILSLIAKSFQHSYESIADREKRSVNWIKSLNDYKLHDKEDLIKISMVKSLSFVKEEFQNLYKTLQIFTDNRDIPFAVLNKFWKKNFVETEEIIVKLHKYSMIEARMNEKTCSLHYLHYIYLSSCVDESEISMYHRQLLESFEVDNQDLEMKFIPEDAASVYFWNFAQLHFIPANRKDLFELYFDFNFLEQKLRCTKLVGLVGDFEFLGDSIVAEDHSREIYIEELERFLANSEQLLYESNDVSLLQLALNSSELIKQQARDQIRKNPNRVWMQDINHGDQTQIIQINANSRPQIIRFIKLNGEHVCLIALEDTDIILQHITKNYHKVGFLYKNEQKCRILNLVGFRDQCFLTLTENGKIAVYSLKKIPMMENFLTSRTIVLSNSRCDDVVQLIEFKDEITCLVISHEEGSQVDLMIGTDNGKIRFFYWKNDKFEEDKKLMINKTHFTGLRHFVKVEVAIGFSSEPSASGQRTNTNQDFECLMLMNQIGDIKFIDLKTSGEIAISKKWEKLNSPVNLHHFKCKIRKKPITICVGQRKVILITHQHIFKEKLIIVCFDEIYNSDSDHHILSSAISPDAKFLVLGTTKGIFIINHTEESVVMRKNISDQVLSLDINIENDSLYVLSAIFEESEKVISLHAFDEKDDKRLLPILLGGDLFDVRKESSSFEMIALDDDKNIQSRKSSDEFENIFDQKKSYYDIKRLIYADDSILVGCTNGQVIEFDSKGNQNTICSLASEISYLEKIEDLIITSCNSEYTIIKQTEKQQLKFYGKITKAFKLKERKLLIVKKDCSIEILDTITNETKEKNLTEDVEEYCTAQAYSSQNIFISSSKRRIFICNTDETSNPKLIDMVNDEEITSLAVSSDNSILAIGFSDGHIQVIIDLLFMIFEIIY